MITKHYTTFKSTMVGSQRAKKFQSARKGSFTVQVHLGTCIILTYIVLWVQFYNPAVWR